MGNVGDVYEVRVETQLEDNHALNLFYYRAAANNIDPIPYLSGGFKFKVFPRYQDLMVPSAYIKSLFVRNLFNPIEFVTEIYDSDDYPGEWVADTRLPDFVGAAFVALRTRLDMRNGYKRVSFLGENTTQGNNFTIAFQGVMATFAAAISDDITDGGYSFDPVIVKRIEYSPSPGKTAYRLPNEPGELTYYLATYTGVRQVSSQATRKIYRNP